MRKILMIAPTPFFADRGCHVRIYKEAKALQNLGYKVTICTYHHGNDVPGLDIRRTINIPWYRKLEAGPSLHKVYLDLLLLYKASRVALEVKPDIIHGHLHEGALIGLIISKITKRPLVFDSQGSLSGEIRSHKYLKGFGLFHLLMRFLEVKINVFSRIIMVSSVESLKTLQESLPNTSRVFLVPDGVDTDEFRRNIDVQALRARLGIPSKKKVVVYLGVLDDYQGIDCLINSIPLVLEKVKDVQFLIMGYPNVETYKTLAKEKKVDGHVSFTGRISFDQAPQYLCLGNIAVAPKLDTTEGNGKVYNYMACGLPTVVFDTPMNRQMLDDLGVYATELGNPVSLAEAIVKILCDSKLSEELGNKLRERAVTHFSWNNTASKLVSCYDIALRQPEQRTSN